MSTITTAWVDYIKEKLKNNDTIIYKELKVDEGLITMIFDSSSCDNTFISDFIISPVLSSNKEFDNIEIIKREIIQAPSAIDIDNKENAVSYIISGEVVILFHFLDKGITCHTAKFPARSVETTSTETVIKGPRVGFNESISDGISLIKSRIKDPNLKFENFMLGKKSQTKVSLVYIEGNAPVSLVNYVREKLNCVTTDYMIYINYIEEELKCKRTPFDTIGYTEKPDTVCVALGEGKIVVLCDGTPFAIYAPYFFIETFRTTDDYTTNKFMAHMGTLLRWGAFFLSTLAPGLYIALFTHHFNLIPYIFVFRVSTSRAGVPFPMIIEVIIMIVFFQVLREAGVRLPQPIGPTLSIVGALILGESAVQSGLTSHVTVLIVAFTSIASFLVPAISTGIFVWNMIILILSSLLGLPGFYMGFILLCTHLSGLTSLGYPYLYPLGTLSKFKYKDIIFVGELDKINQYIFIKDDGNQ